MNSAGIPFYATSQDLLEVLLEVEAARPLRYFRCGDADVSGANEWWDTASDLPSLGIALTGKAVLEQSWLVVARGASPQVREVRLRRGGKRFLVDQLLNPESVTLRSGGAYGSDVIIAGDVGTGSRDSWSQETLRLFSDSMKTHFTQVGAYLVGPEALAQLDRGARLTASVRSSTEYDLRRESN